VRSAEAALSGFGGDVVVLYADTPMLTPEVIAPLFELRGAGADVAVLGFDAADPGAYGRLIMVGEGQLLRIVEAKDANTDERSVRHCNSGVLAASWPLLLELLGQVGTNNANGEYYLTDVIGLARARDLSARVAFAAEDSVLGVNSQAELAAAERLFQRARRGRAMTAGVHLVAPETVFFAHDTELSGGVRVEPNVVFGPGVRVEGGAVIRAFSHLEGAVVREGAIVGPYARLRPGADIGPDAHVGNFCEVKNVRLGQGAKVNHLSYLGDGEVGARANIGAGVIFCNYDGVSKHRTVVGEGAFIGSDCALVAPVTVGAGAMTGSGSVISRDVAPDALALERSPQIEKPGWAAAFRERKRAEKAGR
jgi:bifunctional UDP-N-acetylglucosamine pyrophosphorylase/glucosamine-1-phosphate N-acetyltransferase